MYRVVVVDDEVLIRMYIREILENNGYEVVGEAEDGLDAINVCREQRPDFVIMDISMPVLSGLEAAKVINEEKLAGFIIILTAYRDKDIAKQAVDIDVMGYIVKPKSRSINTARSKRWRKNSIKPKRRWMTGSVSTGPRVC